MTSTEIEALIFFVAIGMVIAAAVRSVEAKLDEIIGLLRELQK